MKNFAAASIALVLALASAVASASEAVPGVPVCLIAVESGTDNPSPGTQRRPHISASITDDVTVAVLLPGTFGGDHLLTLHFITPRGHLYQATSVPTSDSPKLVQVPGYRRAIPAQVPTLALSEGRLIRRVEIRFPIGGTSISANSLYGTWKIVPFLDTLDGSCGPAHTVEIQP